MPRAERAVVDGVDARAAVQDVDARAAVERVVAGAARELRRCRRRAEEPVVAPSPPNRLVPAARRRESVSLKRLPIRFSTWREGVLDAAGGAPAGGEVGGHGEGRFLPARRVDAVAAVEVVATGAADEDVAVGAAEQHVLSGRRRSSRRRARRCRRCRR